MTCGAPDPDTEDVRSAECVPGAVARGEDDPETRAAGERAAAPEDDDWPRALAAVLSNDAEAVAGLLASRPGLRAARCAEGRTLLHWAAEAGAREAAEALLLAGATWHELDGDGFSAGELALAAGRRESFEHLVVSASDAERAARRGPPDGGGPPPKRARSGLNAAYLEQKLRYEEGRLLDAAGRGVMMGWEEPLMARHAEALVPRSGADVLNVGFGLGLVDGFLQGRSPRSHTIVEAHPDVYAEMERRGWPQRPGVDVRRGAWQDVVEHLESGSFDAVFFDTYEETYADMRAFEAHLPRLLRPGGRFSFFNGMASYNIFFHAVYCRMAQDDLRAMGFTCNFLPVELGPPLGSTWRGVTKRYWHFETYYLPLAVLRPQPPDDSAGSPCAGKEDGTAKGGDRWRRWPSLAVQVGDRIDSPSDGGEDGE